MFYENVIRPVLMKFDAEKVHNLSAHILSSSLFNPFFAVNKAVYGKTYPRLMTSLCGISFPHPIGLAAGFDKNAAMYASLHRLGFSFVEIGTVTMLAQPGNVRPRLFRLVRDRAIINRMGFNNAGAEAVALRLGKRNAPTPLGVNIGKSKVTSLDRAIDDYAFSFKALREFASYFVVNVSSPNTPGLRQLQEKKPLLELLQHLMSINREPTIPLLLKIAPDLTDDQLVDIVDVVTRTGVHGVIATNTTISREGLHSADVEVARIGAGGLSGPPLLARSTAIIRFLRQRLPAHVDIVGVGGVTTGADAWAKITAGARCVQIYTGLIYRGPNTVFKILAELDALMTASGFRSLEEAVGTNL